MAVSVRMPEIYSAGTPVDALSLSLTVPVDDLPTAKMETVDEIPMHALVEIFTAQGSAGVFRVTDRAAPFGGTRSLSLRGALDTLSDDIFPGTTALSGTVSAVLGSILAQQTTARWQLGAVCSDAAVKISNSYTDLLSLVNSVRAAVKNTRFVYDFTTTPWTLGLAGMDSTIAGELRIGRNIESASVDISDAELCTRLYMTVTRGSSSTLAVYDNAAAQAEWGIICKTADVNAADVDDPEDYAQEILAERSKPIAYITIEGEDLKNLTDDDFDRLRLGSRCRAVIDGYAEPFVETVTRMEWPDVLGQPDKIRYSLASYLKPFTEQLNLIKKTGAGNARKIEEQERELIRHRADIEKSNERILLWATEEEWSEIAGEYQTTHNSQFEVNAAGISSVVTGIDAGTFKASNAYAVGDVTVHNGKVYVFRTAHAANTPWDPAEVQEALNLYGSVKSHSTRIQQTESKIALVVDDNGIRRGQIVLAINGDGGSEALIQADQIQITGNTTLSGTMEIDGDGILRVKRNLIVNGNNGRQISMNNGTISTNDLSVKSGGALTFVGTATGEHYDLSASTFPNFIRNAQVSGNTLQLWKVTDSDASPSITFNKAVSLSGAWNGSGTYTVSATSGSISGTVPSTTANIQLTGNGSTSFSAELLSDQGVVQSGKSKNGYLHQSGNSVGVYTSYSGGSYSGLIASIPVSGGGGVDPEDADIVEIRQGSIYSSGTAVVEIPMSIDIGVKAAAGGIDEVWQTRSVTESVNITSLLDSLTITSSGTQTYTPPNGIGFYAVAVNIAGPSYAFSCTEQAATWSQSISGYLNCGTISKSSVQANAYLRFRIKCDNAYKYCYITVNQ